MSSRLLSKFAIFVIPFILVIFISSVTEKKNNTTQIEKVKFCKNLDFEKNLLLHPKNFSSKNINLEISFKSEKAWKKNLLNSLIESEKNKKDSGGWRLFTSKSKRYPAFIFVEIPGKYKCKIKARIRKHGDLIDQQDGSILPSLNIHLDNGHIFGITKFILFLPKTRHGSNEIFATELFRSIGMLSPKTMFIDVKYGKSKKKFIFQEKIHKELLESNNLREAPILEGDERFAFWDSRHQQNLSKNKIVNVNWSKKNSQSYKISEYSIAILNHLVQLHQTKDEENDNVDYLAVEKQIFNKDLFVNLDVYDALSVAMGTDHTMPRNERRFYFDPLYKKFYPIYYDGMVNIIKSDTPVKYNAFFDRNDEWIIPSAKNGAPKAIELITNMDLDFLHKRLHLSGLYISKKESDILVKKITDNLFKLKNYPNDRIYKIVLNKKRNPYIEVGEKYDQKLPRKIVFYDKNFNQYLKCDIFGNKCEKFEINDKEKFKLINQELRDKDGNNIIYVGKKKIGNSNENWIYEDYFFKEYKSLELNENVKIIKFGNPEIEINKEQKNIKIQKLDQNDRVVFFGGKLSNWNIEMKDNTNLSKHKIVGNDKNNLTGCLNFYDMELLNIGLSFKDSNCEDAVNFVRVTGSVSKMDIQNSSFDAMDADFSKINFNNVMINKSLNDCLDFSYGEYKVLNSQMSFCGDKAISVGEASYVNIEKTKINNSGTGIASKDFSKVNISQSIIGQSQYCFQVYNKKVEFSGGEIISQNNKCKFNKNLATVDASSKLTLNGINYLESNWKNKSDGVGEYNGI